MGRVNKKQKKEENDDDDDDDDQWSDEIDQSLKTMMIRPTHQSKVGGYSQKGVFPINFWEKEYLQRTKGLSEGRDALNQQKLLKAH